MPVSATIYLRDQQEHQQLKDQAALAGQSVSEYVRTLAELREERITERVASLEARLARLEERAAGLP